MNLFIHIKDYGKSLFFEEGVHSAANTKTREKREGRSARPRCLCLYPSVPANQIIQS